MLSFKIPTQREIPIELVGDYKKFIYDTLLDLNTLIPEDKNVFIPPYEEIDINKTFTFNNLTKDEIYLLKTNLIQMKNQFNYFRLVKKI